MPKRFKRLSNSSNGSQFSLNTHFSSRSSSSCFDWSSSFLTFRFFRFKFLFSDNFKIRLKCSGSFHGQLKKLKIFNLPHSLSKSPYILTFAKFNFSSSLFSELLPFSMALDSFVVLFQLCWFGLRIASISSFRSSGLINFKGEYFWHEF